MKLKKVAFSFALVSKLATSPLASAADSHPRFIHFMRDWEHATRNILTGATGYVPLGHKFSLGPVASFLGYNTLEGMRMAVGGQTSPALSPRLSVGGYAAYGCRDHRWKYSAGATWSFVPVKTYFGAYPEHLLRFAYSSDTYQLGENYLNVAEATFPFRISLRRNEMILYRRRSMLAYSLEPSRQSAIELSAAHERYYPTRYISFGNLNRLNATRVALTADWIPGGDFYQSRTKRIDTKPYSPHLRARVQWVRNPVGSVHANLIIAEISASRLISLSTQIPATLRAMVHGATSLGRGAFPFLPSLPSSPYILRRFGSFALLRPLELPADRMLGAHLTIDDGGLILGLIPGLNLLRWSLTASVDAAAGTLSSRNNPAVATSLPPFPYTPSRMLSWTRPYTEAGIGVNGILGIGRIELVRRLSYTHNRGARVYGIALGIDLKI